MSELSDYKRLVELPNIRRMEIAAAARAGRSKDIGFVYGLLCGFVVTVLAGAFIYHLVH